MDTKEQIDKFQEFFELNYMEHLMNAANQGIDFLIVEFPKLAQHDIVLAESLLETPEDVIQAAEYAISKFDLGNKDVKIVPRFKDLPASSRILIRNIRSKHITKYSN